MYDEPRAAVLRARMHAFTMLLPPNIWLASRAQYSNVLLACTLSSAHMPPSRESGTPHENWYATRSTKSCSASTCRARVRKILYLCLYLFAAGSRERNAFSHLPGHLRELEPDDLVLHERLAERLALERVLERLRKAQPRAARDGDRDSEPLVVEVEHEHLRGTCMKRDVARARAHMHIRAPQTRGSPPQ
jgi:hypothetical protein